MKLFNLSLWFNGFPIKKAKLAIDDIEKMTDTVFEKYQTKRKNEIVNFHLKHNPFYKSFAQKANPNDWNSIPIMTKRDLQQPLQNRLSNGFSKKSVYVNKTSGSSGDPFIFAKDNYCHALTWVGFMKRYGWFNIDFNYSVQARFYGIPLDKKGYYKERIKDFLSKRYRFSVFDLSDQQLKKNLTKFKTTKFDYINGYTSSIVQFAKYLKQENLVLKTICPSLKVCIVTSEMLFENDRGLLEEWIGVPVVNEYGAAELGLIAFQNTKTQWVVNTDDLYLEIVDENNTILPYGEEGRVVITSLYNKAQPLIRYDLGDIGKLSKDSTSQIPILESLIGRTDDIVRLPSGKKAAGLTFYYVTKTIIEDDGNVKEFIIKQLKLDTFKISYVSSYELSEEKLTNIRTAIAKYLEPDLNIYFEQKTALERSKSGKLKQFKSYL